jgi:micrococcal nuclease
MVDQGTLTSLFVIGAAIAVAVMIKQIVSVRNAQREHRASNAGQNGAYRPARVVHVIDGDTVIVSTFWRKLRIRLDSVDCPEQDQHWGDIARYGLIKLIEGHKILFEEHGQDRYGRTIATIYVQQNTRTSWINVNAKMIALGHAWVMRNLNRHLSKNRQDELNNLENWARTKKVGLWQSSHPVPPWKWRGDFN